MSLYQHVLQALRSVPISLATAVGIVIIIVSILVTQPSDTAHDWGPGDSAYEWLPDPDKR